MKFYLEYREEGRAGETETEEEEEREGQRERRREKREERGGRGREQPLQNNSREERA